MIKEEDLHKIGIFAKPHGVKGEISLITNYMLTRITGDFYIVCNIDGINIPFFLESSRQKSASNILVKFKNLDSNDTVKYLTGKPALIHIDYVPLFEDLCHKKDELIGYTLVDECYGVIGTVNDVDDRTPNILLKIDYQDTEILVPLALINTIQHLQQTMNTSLPDGFFDINTTTNETAK